MFKRFKLVAAALVLVASSLVGCGDAPATGQAASPRDERSFGATAGQHALGPNPDAELARLKKAASKASAPTPGHFPGR
ncbi:hypothetical protein [Paludisphaera sp.]|uniref:hypothetical protein n=1 Tax=Paludisphaera sp. TaxID=2017432 RepID=UPI00301C1E84